MYLYATPLNFQSPVLSIKKITLRWTILFLNDLNKYWWKIILHEVEILVLALYTIYVLKFEYSNTVIS